MKRNYSDWLQAYIEYTSFSEAPTHMHFWSGVSAIAGTLRRKVWFDMGYSQWYPNFYIFIVAPPGVVAKSTTTGIAMDLLRAVPGIHFGPDIVTWPALVDCFVESTESFLFNDAHNIMSSITLESSELGNLLDPADRKMVDLLVHLWDGKQGAFDKHTRGSGRDRIENPWINIIACTTPAWVAGNFPEYMIGGGLCSRVVFVYGEEKRQLLAYPKIEMSLEGKFNKETKREKLIEDLISISEMIGEFELTKEGYHWGKNWYENHFKNKPVHLDDERFGGYMARKQSHLHKLAMILAVATSNELVLTKDHLQLADTMVGDLEKDMLKVFSKIGKSNVSVYTDRLIDYVRKNTKLPYTEIYRYIHTYFPSARDFEDIMAGCIKSGKLKLRNEGGVVMVEIT